MSSKEGSPNLPKALGVPRAPACSFVYMSPQLLLSPCRQPDIVMNQSTLNDKPSDLKQSRINNRGSKCQISAIHKVRSINVEPGMYSHPSTSLGSSLSRSLPVSAHVGLMWYEHSPRVDSIAPLDGDYVILPPPFNIAMLTSLERSTFQGLLLDQSGRTKREADLKRDLQKLLLPAPTHADVVAEAVVRAVVDPKINGTIDTKSMKKMATLKEVAKLDAPQPESK